MFTKEELIIIKCLVMDNKNYITRVIDEEDSSDREGLQEDLKRCESILVKIRDIENPKT